MFGIRSVGSANQYGGMYVETAHANGWPFYGYATNGSFRAWSYYNGTSGDWHLYDAGIRLTVPNEGGLRIGPSADYNLVISNTTGSDGIAMVFLMFVTLCLAVGSALMAAPDDPTASFAIPWWTVDGGGDTSYGGQFALSGTAGQADAGRMSGGAYVLTVRPLNLNIGCG